MQNQPEKSLPPRVVVFLIDATCACVETSNSVFRKKVAAEFIRHVTAAVKRLLVSIAGKSASEGLPNLVWGYRLFGTGINEQDRTPRLVLVPPGARSVAEFSAALTDAASIAPCTPSDAPAVAAALEGSITNTQWYQSVNVPNSRAGKRPPPLLFLFSRLPGSYDALRSFLGRPQSSLPDSFDDAIEALVARDKDPSNFAKSKAAQAAEPVLEAALTDQSDLTRALTSCASYGVALHWIDASTRRRQKPCNLATARVIYGWLDNNHPFVNVTYFYSLLANRAVVPFSAVSKSMGLDRLEPCNISDNNPLAASSGNASWPSVYVTYVPSSEPKLLAEISPDALAPWQDAFANSTYVLVIRCVLSASDLDVSGLMPGPGDVGKAAVLRPRAVKGNARELNIPSKSFVAGSAGMFAGVMLELAEDDCVFIADMYAITCAARVDPSKNGHEEHAVHLFTCCIRPITPLFALAHRLPPNGALNIIHPAIPPSLANLACIELTGNERTARVDQTGTGKRVSATDRHEEVKLRSSGRPRHSARVFETYISSTGLRAPLPNPFVQNGTSNSAVATVCQAQDHVACIMASMAADCDDTEFAEQFEEWGSSSLVRPAIASRFEHALARLNTANSVSVANCCPEGQLAAVELLSFLHRATCLPPAGQVPSRDRSQVENVIIESEFSARPASIQNAQDGGGENDLVSGEAVVCTDCDVCFDAESVDRVAQTANDDGNECNNKEEAVKEEIDDVRPEAEVDNYHDGQAEEGSDDKTIDIPSSCTVLERRLEISVIHDSDDGRLHDDSATRQVLYARDESNAVHDEPPTCDTEKREVVTGYFVATDVANMLDVEMKVIEQIEDAQENAGSDRVMQREVGVTVDNVEQLGSTDGGGIKLVAAYQLAQAKAAQNTRAEAVSGREPVIGINDAEEKETDGRVAANTVVVLKNSMLPTACEYAEHVEKENEDTIGEVMQHQPVAADHAGERRDAAGRSNANKSANQFDYKPALAGQLAERNVKEDVGICEVMRRPLNYTFDCTSGQGGNEFVGDSEGAGLVDIDEDMIGQFAETEEGEGATELPIHKVVDRERDSNSNCSGRPDMRLALVFDALKAIDSLEDSPDIMTADAITDVFGRLGALLFCVDESAKRWVPWSAIMTQSLHDIGDVGEQIRRYRDEILKVLKDGQPGVYVLHKMSCTFLRAYLQCTIRLMMEVAQIVTRGKLGADIAISKKVKKHIKPVLTILTDIQSATQNIQDLFPPSMKVQTQLDLFLDLVLVPCPSHPILNLLVCEIWRLYDRDPECHVRTTAGISARLLKTNIRNKSHGLFTTDLAYTRRQKPHQTGKTLPMLPKALPIAVDSMGCARNRLQDFRAARARSASQLKNEQKRQQPLRVQRVQVKKARHDAKVRSSSNPITRDGFMAARAGPQTSPRRAFCFEPTSFACQTAFSSMPASPSTPIRSAKRALDLEDDEVLAPETPARQVRFKYADGGDVGTGESDDDNDIIFATPVRQGGSSARRMDRSKNSSVRGSGARLSGHHAAEALADSP
jgi:hypothetical protein